MLNITQNKTKQNQPTKKEKKESLGADTATLVDEETKIFIYCLFFICSLVIFFLIWSFVAVIKPQIYWFFAYSVLYLPHEDKLKKKTKMNGRYLVSLILNVQILWDILSFTSYFGH